MKKLLYLLLLIPLGFLASCSSDDDYPSVDIEVTFSNASVYNNVVYVLDGTNLTIDNIGIKSLNGSAATLANMTFFWDGAFQPGMTFGAYPLTLETATQPIGRHYLQFNCELLEVDKSILNGTFTYPVIIIEDEEDLPAGAPQEFETYKSVITVNPK
ncbi:MAG: hypothetical protein K2J29_04590 [Muribaculaceae bacterium]|nr:hypothetical protein [Muribaculaceae bacterium]